MTSSSGQRRERSLQKGLTYGLPTFQKTGIRNIRSDDINTSSLLKESCARPPRSDPALSSSVSVPCRSFYHKETKIWQFIEPEGCATDGWHSRNSSSSRNDRNLSTRRTQDPGSPEGLREANSPDLDVDVTDDLSAGSLPATG